MLSASSHDHQFGHLQLQQLCPATQPRASSSDLTQCRAQGGSQLCRFEEEAVVRLEFCASQLCATELIS